jgi:hypothetical protein
MQEKEDDISRTFKYAIEFYMKRLGLIVIFSIPFILAFLIPVLVPAPTYVALGGVFLRTGSLPELSLADIIVTVIAYALAMFVFVDTIVNINIVVRSKRTLTAITHEVFSAFSTYALRIFFVYTVIMVIMFVTQILTYEHPLQSWIYPLVGFAIMFLMFFVPPAVVIDNSDVPAAMRRSMEMALKNPHFVILWAFITLLSISVIKIVADLVFSNPFSGYFVLLTNSLLILPFLTVLQTQMYMEKYPLAR